MRVPNTDSCKSAQLNPNRRILMAMFPNRVMSSSPLGHLLGHPVLWVSFRVHSESWTGDTGQQLCTKGLPTLPIYSEPVDFMIGIFGSMVTTVFKREWRTHKYFRNFRPLASRPAPIQLSYGCRLFIAGVYCNWSEGRNMALLVMAPVKH